MARIVVDKSTDNADATLDLFFTTISTSEKIPGFFSEREPKKALHDTWTRAALSGRLSTTANYISQSDCEISSNCGKKNTSPCFIFRLW